MNDSLDNNWRLAPEPQTELERLIKRAAGKRGASASQMAAPPSGERLITLICLPSAAPAVGNLSVALPSLDPTALSMSSVVAGILFLTV